MTIIKTHCQICAREIKTVPGYPKADRHLSQVTDRDAIAHHGYARPYGQGYQTSSCFGARWRPYEVACDALPPYTERLQGWLAREQAQHFYLTASPPATLEYRRHSMSKVVTQLARPEGFDPLDPSPEYGHATYRHEFLKRVATVESAIDHLRRDIRNLQNRLAAWRAA